MVGGLGAGGVVAAEEKRGMLGKLYHPLQVTRGRQAGDK